MTGVTFTNSLPELLPPTAPILGAALAEAEENMQASYGLCLAAALSAVSTACQGLVDVRTPFGTGPTGLFITAIAPPGEGKSKLEQLFMKKIRTRDIEALNEQEELGAAHSAALMEWKIKRGTLEKQLKALLKEREDTSMVLWSLEEHLKSRPEPKKIFQMISEDTTKAAFFQRFSVSGVGALISSEGGIILEGKASEMILQLNKIWSGESTDVARLRSRMHVSQPRLTMLLMLQRAEFDALVHKKGERNRGNGFWSRVLPIVPESTQGKRSFCETDVSWDRLERFHSRVGDLLDQLVEKHQRGDFGREVLEFTEEAAAFWARLGEDVQRQIAPGARYEQAADHAAKLTENVARVAALLHYFEGIEGRINTRTLQLAWEICDRCSTDFLDLFVPPREEQKDAETVWNQQLQKYRARGLPYVSTTYALRRRPSCMRSDSAVRYHQALDVLQDTGYLRLIVDDKKTEWIILDPGFFPHMQARWPMPVLPPQQQPAYPTFGAVKDPEHET